MGRRRLPTAERDRFLAALVALVLVTSLAAAVPVASAAAGEEEPNDGREAATSISTGTTVDGSIDPSDDDDWFAFTAEAGETINVTMVTESGNGKNNMKLKTRSAQRGGTDVSANGSGFMGTTARYTGTYYVQVKKDFFADQGVGYTLRVNTSETDDFEPNEDRANATRITANTTQSGDVTVGDTDWFRFEAERGETINVTMTAGSGGTNNVKLFDRSSQRDGVDASAGDPGSVGTTARYTGTYYVQVKKDFFASHGADYTIDVRTYRTDPFEPNENLSMAVALFENPFTPAQARLSIGDSDYFNYHLEAGATIRAVAAVPAGEANQKLRLYRPGDDSPDNATDVAGGETEVGSLTAQSSGSHYVAFERDNDEQTGPYNVTITAAGEIVGPPNDRFERDNPPIGNQDRANATAIEPGRYANLGMVDDDRDVFTFRAARDARIVVNTSYDTSVNDLAVEAVAPDGTTIQPDGNDDSLAFNTSASGTHVLRVSGQAGAQAEYALRLNVSSSAPPQLPDGSGQPTDPDGDGRFEDTDGDGEFNVVDVAFFLDVFGSATVGDNTAAFDFNGDGRINIVDVAVLLAET
jgi:hypothetical protein